MELHPNNIACTSLTQDSLEVVNTPSTATVQELLTELVWEVKKMNTWLMDISSDVAVQEEMLAKPQTDQGCKVCQEDIEHSPAEVENADDIQKSQKLSTFYW